MESSDAVVMVVVVVVVPRKVVSVSCVRIMLCLPYIIVCGRLGSLEGLPSLGTWLSLENYGNISVSLSLEANATAVIAERVLASGQPRALKGRNHQSSSNHNLQPFHCFRSGVNLPRQNPSFH